jgi:energy-coupling factor transport system permease protein
MIKNITMGQYYFADSLIHRLDPRVKLFWTFLYIISLFFVEHWQSFVIATLIAICYVKSSKVPFAYVLKGIKPVYFILFFTLFFNLFFTTGGEILWEYGIFSITSAGVKLALTVSIRLILLMIVSCILTYTTTPNRLTDALETSLGFLNKIHIPVHSIAMMMSITLRFIPVLMEEADKIMKAQLARGADFEQGSLITKAKNMLPLLVPLFVSAFRRASDLAMAMEARCYHGGEGRTKMHPLVYQKKDKGFYGCCVLYIAMLVVAECCLPVIIENFIS